MDKPINQIIAIKSYEQLKSYLDDKPNLNLAILLDKNGTNLLHFAAYNNDISKMKLFVRHYKQFTIMNHGTGMYTGETTFTGKLKAWVNSQNNQGYLPIHYAALHGNIEMIKFLQEAGVNMNYRTSKDENVLFMAAQYKHTRTLIYLLQSSYNYDINTRNCRQQTILHIAAMKGYIQMISYLLTMGADIEATESTNSTPLIVATKQNKREAVKILLIKGANRSAYDNQQKTALQIAQENGKQQLVKILDDNYGTWDKIQIKCNKKITYAPQKPTYTYSIIFICLFHLFFLPVNILTEMNNDQKYVKLIPFIMEGIYQLLVFLFYILLFKKFKKRPPLNLFEVPSPFCAECRRELDDKSFHCYICERCVYRYDHHCPWINNCVGSHNIGKFTFFLFLLMVGLAQVILCSISMILGLSFVRYRAELQIPVWFDKTINIVTIIFGSIMLFGISKIFFGQIRNIFSNTTSMERSSQKKKSSNKASTILTQNNLDDSLIANQQEFQQEIQKSSCFGNAVIMLSGPK